MTFSRRQLLVLAGMWTLASSATSKGQTVPPQPAPGTLRTGDLIFPLKPNSCTPLSAGTVGDPVTSREAWTRARQEVLDSVPSQRSAEVVRLIERLRAMTYEEFIREFNGLVGTGRELLGSNHPAVGHVALIDRQSDGTLHVLEAQTSSADSSKPGVRSLLWSEWYKGREDDNIWHARMRGISASDATKVVAAARGQIGRPYSIRPSSLLVTDSFYCSKLVWFAFSKALDKALDGNSDPDRFFWVTPSNILGSALLDRLHQPRDFRC